MRREKLGKTRRREPYDPARSAEYRCSAPLIPPYRSSEQSERYSLWTRLNCAFRLRPFLEPAGTITGTPARRATDAACHACDADNQAWRSTGSVPNRRARRLH